jgi:molecular chaperone GrpE
MKHKDKQEPKEEKTAQNEGGAADFYGMLDSLLPLKNELLQDLRTVLEDCKKRSEETLSGDKNKPDYVLQLEEEKTKCLLELYKIALNQYLRVSADYANYQKRVPKQMADSIAYEKERMARVLLPVLDNFERTLRNAHQASNADSIIKGVGIICDQMLDVLKLQGVERIKAVGEEFDPGVHEAVIQKNEPEKEGGIVLEELEGGYKLNGRVLRPSKVIVNKVTSTKPTEQAAEGGETKQTTEDETTDTE